MQRSMQFDVVDMAMSKATKFESQHSLLVWFRPIAKAIFRVPVAVALLCAAWFVDRLARDFAEKAIWFRGAAARLQDYRLDRELDPHDKALDHLENVEKELLEFRGNVMNLLELRRRGVRKAPKGRVTPSLERLAAAAGDLYEEIRGFRGAMRAHDADVCTAKAGQWTVWTTGEQVDEGIRALSSR